MTNQKESGHGSASGHQPGVRSHALLDGIVRTFLNSNLSLILILLAALLGLAALIITPREEDPQIVVPLADVYVNFPGHSAAEVEQLVSTPLEKLLYEIDGVEYVYSMSREGQAVITVRYYVGQDRERSLVKLYKRIDEHVDTVPPGVTGWVIKPVEIDDVPIVTLTLRSATTDQYGLRRVAEEVVDRLAPVEDISRAYVVGGQPRIVYVHLSPDRMQAFSVSPLEVQRAIQGANVTESAGEYARLDKVVQVDAGTAFVQADELKNLVVSVFGGRPVYLRDVAEIVDGPEEAVDYVRHGWGPARGFEAEPGFTGTLIGGTDPAAEADQAREVSLPAVTIALAKKRGTNAVWVAESILRTAEKLKHDVIPDDIEVVITRNAGLSANHKVNELVESLAVAVFIVIALLTLGLGWREALIVAVAVPVVFGLTLAVNLVAGYTINRVTLFALILSLGLLVDDPIVDVENIARHFSLRRKATRQIVVEAVSEIRPPLITATLAVIVSFLPMLFITGMMGPYMRPMALNLPVTMVMSMLVAFTITPWLSYHMLKHRYAVSDGATKRRSDEVQDEDDIEVVRGTFLYRVFQPLMAPLLRKRRNGWLFLGVMVALLLFAGGLAATRRVPLKMLPFDNKNELELVLDLDEGTTLERTDAAVRDFERYLAAVPEVTDFTSYVGVGSPMDFNGLVRHYYLRRGDNVAEIRIDLVGKKSRALQSHAIGLRMRNDLDAIAKRHNVRLKIVETPPGPPVLATIVAEVYGQPDNTYADLMAAGRTVEARLQREPGVVDVDTYIEADSRKLVFVTDKEKAALNGVSVAEVASTIQAALGGAMVGTVQLPDERNPLRIELRVPRAERSGPSELAAIDVKGQSGTLVPLAEIGDWRDTLVDKTIYHKNLERVVYVLGDTAGRAPADCVVDIEADQIPSDEATKRRSDEVGHVGSGWVAETAPRPVEARTFLTNGGGIAWGLPAGLRVNFAGEGEWQITLDVFRDLGLAFGAALIAIYILLVGQMRSFSIPVVLMMAIPLTVIGIMPGFWLLNLIAAHNVGGYGDPVFFTATGMIGMIALAGIVTRQAVIIIDFVHLSLARGHTLFDAILASCVVRLRPILLTVSTAMVSAAPIALDPIFSGLAWALIFGLFASTVFTLFVIPVVYWLVYEHKPGHGVAVLSEDDGTP